MERTDIHRPSVIEPKDYEYVGIEFQKIESFGDVPVVEENRKRIQAHMARTGGTYSNHEHGGSCHICGAWAIYTVLFYHPKTNTYIRTGNDCADKLDLGYNSNEMSLFRAAIHDAREAQAGKKKAQALLADRNLSVLWDVYELVEKLNFIIYRTAASEAELDAANARIFETIRVPYEETTIHDIVSKLIRYGNISDNAANFASKLFDKISQRVALREQREAESASAVPAPTGRVRIQGTVLGMRTEERNAYYYGDSGIVTKVLIQADGGWKVWGNRFDNVEKGDRVDFVATIQVSDRDPKFGFFKRPTAYVPKVPKASKALMKTIAWA